MAQRVWPTVVEALAPTLFRQRVKVLGLRAATVRSRLRRAQSARGLQCPTRHGLQPRVPAQVMVRSITRLQITPAARAADRSAWVARVSQFLKVPAAAAVVLRAQSRSARR